MVAVKVYLITGWFGDHEWVEEIHATKAGAEGKCEALWVRRRSHKAPEYAQGVCKFAVEEREVVA